MAFKLNKEENARRDELVAKLEIANSEMEEAVVVANEAINALLAPINEKITAYNEVLAEVREYVEEVAGRWQEEFDEKSEKWQEGDKGVEVSELITSWNDMDFEDIEGVTIDQIEDIDVSHRDDLENAPSDALS